MDTTATSQTGFKDEQFALEQPRFSGATDVPSAGFPIGGLSSGFTTGASVARGSDLATREGTIGSSGLQSLQQYEEAGRPVGGGVGSSQTYQGELDRSRFGSVGVPQQSIGGMTSEPLRFEEGSVNTGKFTGMSGVPDMPITDDVAHTKRFGIGSGFTTGVSGGLPPGQEYTQFGPIKSDVVPTTFGRDVVPTTVGRDSSAGTSTSSSVSDVGTRSFGDTTPFTDDRQQTLPSQQRTFVTEQRPSEWQRSSEWQRGDVSQQRGDFGIGGQRAGIQPEPVLQTEYAQPEQTSGFEQRPQSEFSQPTFDDFDGHSPLIGRIQGRRDAWRDVGASGLASEDPWGGAWPIFSEEELARQEKTFHTPSYLAPKVEEKKQLFDRLSQGVPLSSGTVYPPGIQPHEQMLYQVKNEVGVFPPSSVPEGTKVIPPLEQAKIVEPGAPVPQPGLVARVGHQMQQLVNPDVQEQARLENERLAQEASARMRDPNAPLLERASAAVSVVTQTVTATLHSTAKVVGQNLPGGGIVTDTTVQQRQSIDTSTTITTPAGVAQQTDTQVKSIEQQNLEQKGTFGHVASSDFNAGYGTGSRGFEGTVPSTTGGSSFGTTQPSKPFDPTLATQDDIRRHEQIRAENERLAHEASLKMRDPNAPILERASAAVTVVGQNIAASYHEAAKAVDETILEKGPEIRGVAEEGIKQHEIAEKQHEQLAVEAKERLWDPNAPIATRAAAAAATVGHVVAGTYHRAVKEADSKTLETAPG
jgi:hypothetical protein